MSQTQTLFDLSNPIYKLSGETEKIAPIAIQASVSEDLESRRRQLDDKGEQRKIIIAKNISHMVDASGTIINLHPAPWPAEEHSLLQSAKEAAGNAAANVVNAAKDTASVVTDAAKGTVTAVTDAAIGTVNAAKGAAIGTVTAVTDAAKGTANAAKGAAIGTANVVTDAAKGTANTVSNVAAGAVDTASRATTYAANEASHLASEASQLANNAFTKAAQSFRNAAGYVSHAAAEAAHQAVVVKERVVDKAADVAGAVTSKTKELAEGAANKAHAVADNISHFTAMMSLIAAEETERQRRLNDADETQAVLNAMKVSNLLRDLGQAFYRQPTPNLNYSTKLLEEIERRWRLSAPHTAAQNARNLGKLVSSNVETFQHFIPRAQLIRGHINSIEDKERLRRLNDPDEVYAIWNAFALRDVIRSLGYEFYRQEGKFDKFHSAYATTLLEENERKNRIRTHNLPHAEDSTHLLLDVVANNIERFNFSTRQISHFLNDFASKLGNTTIQATQAFSEKTKEFAQSTVQRVQALAGDISNFTALMYVLALEERERVRRLNDDEEIYAIQNAWKQAGLIRELEGFWRGRSNLSYPTTYLEEIERRWRINQADKKAISRARAVAAIVNENLDKFNSVHTRLEHAREVALHSRLNPKAAPFVPSSKSSEFAQKVAPVQTQQRFAAAGAQL